MAQRKQGSALISWVFRASADAVQDDELYSILVEHCDNFAFQLESAPTTGYLHYQGCFFLINRKRFQWIQDNIMKFEYLCKMNGKPHQAWAYSTKAETRVEGPYEYGECPVNGQKKNTNEVFSRALAAPTVSEGIAIVQAECARDYCLHGESIRRNIKASKVVIFTAKFKLTDFLIQPLILIKPVLLYGESNTGKTSFAVAHFKNPLVVSHIDKLKLLSPDNDAIVFDDMSFTHWPAEAVIHLLDIDFERDINVRYGTVTIPANTIKVFTHNNKNPFYKEEIQQVQIDAIERRFQRVHVQNSIKKPVVLAPTLAAALEIDINAWNDEADAQRGGYFTDEESLSYGYDD